MIEFEFFTYTDAQWDEIKSVVGDRLDRDADQIERQITRTLNTRSVTGMESLRDRIETGASIHIMRSAFESQTPGHKARIKQLKELRDRAEVLRDEIIDVLAPSFTIKSRHAGGIHRMMPDNADVIGTTHRAIAKVVNIIDASIAAQRPQQNANSRKAGRDRFWEEMLAIWTSIGGAETGTAAAEFIVATSKPVFDRVLAIGGHKTAASTPQDHDAVEAWLRLRAKARRTATP